MVDGKVQEPAVDAVVDYSALPVGGSIGRFHISAVLGQGGFGITYRARDEQLGRDVAIKEYLPVSLAIRHGGVTVLPRSTKVAEDFTWGRDRFVEEGRTLASLHEAPAIVRVFDFLELNGTAYIVMELVRGATLEDRIKRQGKLSSDEVAAILWPMLDGLAEIHKVGFLHRDIKPANILLREDGRPTLIDFGASRAAMAGRTTAMTAIFTPGYAAAEQMTAAKQGPWTDIYGLSATLYHAITGSPPPPAFDRMLHDDYVPLSKLAPAGFSPSLLIGLDAGLAVRAAERPQTIAGWRTLLTMTPAAAADVTQRIAADSPDTLIVPHGASAALPSGVPAAEQVSIASPVLASSQSVSGSRKAPLYVGVAAAVLLLAGGGYFVMRGSAPAVTDNVASAPRLQDMKVEDLERVLAERRAAEAEAAERRKAEEEARQKFEADSAAKSAADAEVAKAEAARLTAQAELAKLKAELEALRLDQEAQARKAEAEAAQRRAEAEMASLKAAEDEARRRAEIEAEAKREADKALAKAQEERQKAEEEAQKRAAEEAKQKAEASAKQIEEAEKKANADAEAAAKAARAEADKKAAEAAESALGLASADREKVQIALTSLGFDTRGTDGTLGPRSREMISAWQKARNQPVTGFLSGAQHQALLREAAPALQKHGDEQKKKEEDERKKAEEAKKAVDESTKLKEAAAAAPPPAASGSGPIPDGTYSGSFNSTVTINTGGSAINVKVAGMSASGTISNARCGSAPVSLKLAPTGEVTGEMTWLDMTCGRIPLSVQGRASGRQLQLRMSGPGASGSATLSPGTAPTPAAAAPQQLPPSGPAVPAQPAGSASATGGGWSGVGNCNVWGGSLPLTLLPGQTSGKWTGPYGSVVALTISGSQFSGTIGSSNRSGSKTYTGNFSGTISGNQISARTVARADFKNNDGPNELHCTIQLAK
jgi:serine/threonine protein kinase